MVENNYTTIRQRLRACCKILKIMNDKGDKRASYWYSKLAKIHNKLTDEVN